MTEATQVAAEAASAEHVNAQAVATEAAERARAAQIREIMQESDERMTRMLGDALEKVFGPDDKGTFVNVQRIPLICKDIVTIKDGLAGINNNIQWAVRIVIGGVIAGLLALLLK